MSSTFFIVYTTLVFFYFYLLIRKENNLLIWRRTVRPGQVVRIKCDGVYVNMFIYKRPSSDFVILQELQGDSQLTTHISNIYPL